MDEEIKTPDMDDLSRWFSAARMSRYAATSDPAALYLWDARLSKAYLEDIEHVEVLLRNFVDVRLRRDCKRCKEDERWFDHADLCNLGDGFRSSLAKARRRLAREGKCVTTDALVAALSLDTWRFLLVRRLEDEMLETYTNALNWVAQRIDPEAADWIRKNSRVSDVRRERPE